MAQNFISAPQDFNVLSPLTSDQVYTKCRLKINPRTGEILEAVEASRPIFKALSGVEERFPRKRKKAPAAEVSEGIAIAEVEDASSALGDVWEKQGSETRQRAASRAKKRLFDLARCNSFDMMFTCTLSAEKLNRYSYEEAIHAWNIWAGNRVQRKGLLYVAVPELHKDGAIHFHGLLNSSACKLQRARNAKTGRLIYSKGRPVWNITDWTVGFTSAVFLDENYDRACNYVSKYITKAEKQNAGKGPIGGRYFFHGGKLLEPVFAFPSAICSIAEGRSFDLPAAGLTLTYYDPEAIIIGEETSLK